MRIWAFSDLHVDVHPYSLPPDRPEHDVVVIAGDVGERLTQRSLPWIRANVGSDRPVVYVPGNHDFYRTTLQREIEVARPAAADLGIHLLAEVEAVVIGGTRFVGATLWTDYAIRAEYRAAALAAAGDRDRGMNDRRHIKSYRDGAYSAFRPLAAAAIHVEHRSRIRSALAQPHDGLTVVVTHHAPHERSLQHGEWRDFLDGAYASDLSELLTGPTAPALWIHGHVHVCRDYRVGGTRVVANPRGYVLVDPPARGRPERVEAENPGFDPCLVLEV